MSAIDHGLEASKQRAEERREAFVQSIPEDLREREDRLPVQLRAENASAQSKLGRIYALVDEFSALRASHVACGKGCSDCCRMNVQISNVEAARIERGTGLRARPLAHSVTHDDAKFAGAACTFLHEEVCTIYEYRPYVCRNHASFDVDAYWCDPVRMHAPKMPRVQMGGVDEALLDVLKGSRNPVLADIRDFFPQK
jgi:Fe-S-cluster containining protein